MKLLSLVPLCLLLACSSPRYTYRFSEPKGAEVTRQASVIKVVDSAALRGPTRTAEPHVVYSADVASPVPAPRSKDSGVNKNPAARMPIVPIAITGLEKGTEPSSAKSPPADGHLDGDLQRAIIFAAFGVVALLVGGNFFVVTGSLSLLIGLIFGIRWFIRR